MTYKAGDIVRLKSGGPKMTILRADEATDSFACKWFDRNGKRHSDSFPAAMVEPFIGRSPEDIARVQTPKKPKTYDKPFEHKPFKG